MNNLAILTTIFNHTDNPYFYSNWLKFTNSLYQAGILKNLFVCEILPDGQSSQIDNQNINHWVVKNNSRLWHKESGLNFLLNKIPNFYDGIIISDNDILCDNIEWYSNTYDLLNRYIAVQPFDHIDYLLYDNTNIELSDYGLCKKYQMSNTMSGNPGLLMAYRREYLDYIGGFFDECLVGGGDVINALPFFSSDSDILSSNILNMVCPDRINHLINYVSKAKLYLKKHTNNVISFLSNHNIRHLFHGYWKHRRYGDRYSIINSCRMNSIFKKNDLHFYEIIDNEIELKLTNFFNQRLSFNNIDRPIISCSSKYTPDSPHVLWLNPDCFLNIQNINKLKIVLNNPLDAKNINISIDSQIIDTVSLAKNKQQEIFYEKPRYIKINCEKTSDPVMDARELGLYISDIEIMTKNTGDSFISYPLDQVL